MLLIEIEERKCKKELTRKEINLAVKGCSIESANAVVETKEPGTPALQVLKWKNQHAMTKGKTENIAIAFRA